MFRGVTTLNLDVKGRFAIPTRYRERIQACCDARLVVTVDRDECLLLYPEPEWVEIERKLRNLPSLNRQARALQRLYIGHAQELEMDAQGRILVAPELRQFARLDKRLALVGQVNKFELWNEDTWNARRSQWLAEVSLDDLDRQADLEGLSF
jgi:MraZ protein